MVYRVRDYGINVNIEIGNITKKYGVNKCENSIKKKSPPEEKWNRTVNVST